MTTETHTTNDDRWTSRPVPKPQHPGHTHIQHGVIEWVLRHWLLLMLLAWGVYIGLPWLAPVLMRAGYTEAASATYTAYATQCHQLPQRSFFVFGPQLSYPLAKIQTAWHATNDASILRQFIGNEEMGWKVAWSDRMVALYGSIWLAGMAYGLLRRHVKPLPLSVFALLALPMVVDGTTHMLSDLAGIGQGFRDTNVWLASWTGNTLPPSFYAGDALGSFNSSMRLITGMLFGVGVVWLAFPYLDRVWSEFAARR